MINIILNGCGGKMGKTITSSITNFPNLNIVAGIDAYYNGVEKYPIFENISKCNIKANVVLDFSRPDSLESIIKFCIEKNLPLVLCTTGFTEEQIDIINTTSKSIPIFRSGNMSLGINVVNSILKQVSALLYDGFDIEIIEKHHNQKVDAPSGTALLLADTIKASILEETSYIKGRDGIAKRQHNEIGIHAIRGGNIIGEHSVIFAGQGEVIEIKHEALSRDVFAVGALKACGFIQGKLPGMYNMDDLINQSIKG
ncbi:MAG: 4-hydroxy-tetrahydrodipicolinate reductase [Clostridiaceae bacterium]|nr:4-hydroxy-tetrahydrodipicolinate reductase [Clostridiaceae bacterium]